MFTVIFQFIILLIDILSVVYLFVAISGKLEINKFGLVEENYHKLNGKFFKCKWKFN